MSGLNNKRYLDGDGLIKFWEICCANFPARDGRGATGDWDINITGNAATSTLAVTAGKLNTNAGSATKPVYFGDGIPKQCNDTLTVDISGNAGTADKWKTARKITLTGGVTGNVSIDGSKNVTLTTEVDASKHVHSQYYDITTEQSPNTVYAGPSSGTSKAAASFRKLVVNDLPDLSGIYLPLTGGTISGQLGFTGTKYPHIYGNGTNLHFGTSKNENSKIVIDDKSIRTGTTSTQLGRSSYPWPKAYITTVIGDLEGIADEAKIAKATTGTLTIKQPNATSVTFNGSESKEVAITRDSLGLAKVMEYIGKTTTTLSDGATTNPITIDSKSVTVTKGNVVIDSSDSREYIWNGSKWEKFGEDATAGNYKPKQAVVSSPTASGNSTSFIDTISQDENGKITATKKSVNFGGYKPTQTAVSSPTASGNEISFIDTISQNANGVITATRKTVRNASTSQSGVVTTGAQTFAGVKTFKDGLVAGSSSEENIISIHYKDTDKFIMWDYDNDLNAGASWRIGALGTGTGNTNYFTIQSGTSTTNNNTWATILNIGQTDFTVYFDKTPKVGSTFVSLEGHTHNYLPLSGGNLTGSLTSSSYIEASYFRPTLGASILSSIDSSFKTHFTGSNNINPFISVGRPNFQNVGKLLGNYSPIIAFGVGDTHGFLQVPYNAAGNIRVGGGNNDSIVWTADLIHSENYADYCASKNHTHEVLPKLLITDEPYFNIRYNGKNVTIGVDNANGELFRTTPGWTASYRILDSSNCDSFIKNYLTNYVSNVNNAQANKFFESSFQASNRPNSSNSNYATGLTLYNSELKYSYQLAGDTNGKFYTRYCNQNSNWYEWKQLATINDISSLSVPIKNVTFTPAETAIGPADVFAKLGSNYAMGKGTWDYAGNGYISKDTTGSVAIDLAGCNVIQFVDKDAYIHDVYTQLYITAPASTSPSSKPNEILLYNDHGPNYSPAWTRVLTDRNYSEYCLPLSGGNMLQNARIAASEGDLFIGNASNSAWVNIQDMRSANGSTYWYIYADGRSFFGNTITATNFITSSDKRLKTNIHEISSDKLSDALNVNFYEFDYVNNDNHSAGHIAQEVKEVLPEFVHGEETETEHLSIDYTGLHSVQIKALKDKVETLETENKELRERLEKLEKLIEKFI